jgi:hypothetical protein
MGREGCGVVGGLAFPGILPGHLDESAQRKKADFVVRLTVLEAEEARPKTKGKGFYADFQELGNGEVAELVNNNHEADKDKERYGGNDDLVNV